MELGYHKADHRDLFSLFSKSDTLNLHDAQNYIPLYGQFFGLSSSNTRNFVLDYPLRLETINDKTGSSQFKSDVVNAKGVHRSAEVFFKFCPILDPLRYVTGKYDVQDENLFRLPSVEDERAPAKTRDPNNSAYVDGFFSYLAARLHHDHHFVHALDSYGSFVAMKQDFQVDVADDMDHLASSEFFSNHEGKLFHFDEAVRERFSRGFSGSGRRRTPLIMGGKTDQSPETVTPKTCPDMSQLDTIFCQSAVETSEASAPGLELVFENNRIREADANSNGDGDGDGDADADGNGDTTKDQVKTQSKIRESARNTSSTCSSRSSGTDEENDDPGSESDSGSDCSGTDYSQADTASSMGDDRIMLSVNHFPVQATALEKCDATLDNLMLQRQISVEEWESIMFQVVATLMAYDKCFRFTHNDLHTNNIMYIRTDKQYLNYKIDGQYYKVPTYGKLFKIIDFGRAIYDFRGKRICSDSFHRRGDAATQYNCEPYMNTKRPRLDPNPSFDLCRLGCSLYDFLDDEYGESEYRVPDVIRMILNWCNDDKGRNVLYKRSGIERYPNFKLYKMIARTVHKHTPANALKNDCMQRYKSSRSNIGRKAKIMNIDSLPCFSDLPVSTENK